MNRVLEHLGCEFPIIQSPMGWIARAQLASAVSNAGGLGMIETSSGELDNCMAEIRAMKKLTDKPFGVNLPLLLLQGDDMLNAVIDAGVKFVTTSAGDPGKYIHKLKDAGITVYHAVPTVKLALKAAKAGVDGLIVEGYEGGGFKNPGEVSTGVLLQAIRQSCPLPLVAAGGIADGRGMATAFAAGAEGAQMGTRFVCSAESPVHNNYKQAIADCEDTGTTVVNKLSKPWVRVLKTDTSLAFAETGKMEDQSLAKVKDVYFGGDMNASVAIAGQSAGLIDHPESVATIISNTVEEFFSIEAEAGRRASQRSF